jgi:hypothetical protein
VSLMILPDYSSGSGEKDINVLGFNLRSVPAMSRWKLWSCSCA